METQEASTSCAVAPGTVAPGTGRGSPLDDLHAEFQRLLRAAAHDLSAPARHITGFGGLLAESLGPDLPTSDAGHLRRMFEAATRLDAIVVGLRRYSETLAPLRLERVDADAVARGVLARMGTGLQESGARVTIAEPLPCVRADRARLGEVVAELIDNGVAHRGQTPPEVSLHALRAEDLWRFEIRSNGAPIPEDLREAVFAPFRTLRSDAPRERVGLGLALCRRALARMGGSIWAESGAAQGNTFCFTLPVS